MAKYGQTYNQYYKAAKRRAAKKMSPEERRKLNEARKMLLKQEGRLFEQSLCRTCAYDYQHTCTLDGTENPAKTVCKDYMNKKKWAK